MKSVKNSLNRNDLKDAGKSAVIFLIPLILIYLAQLSGTFSQANHTFSVADFALSSFTLGALTKYISDQLLGLYKRFSDGKRK